MVRAHYRNKFLKRRAGISLVECLLMMIIVALAIGAILQTAGYASRLQTSGRRYVDSHRDAVSFMNILDSLKREEISGDTIILAAAKNAGFRSDLLYVTSPAITLLSADGMISVAITVTESDNSRRTITKYFNNYNNRTVSDDREKKAP